MDPGIASLLEGSAFMAARVQLKLKSEFSRIHVGTSRSAAAELPGADPVGGSCPGRATLRGPRPRRGQGASRAATIIDAVYVEQERRVACRFRLRSDLELWPLSLETAEYYATPAPLHALGLEVAPDVMSGTAARLPAPDVAPGHRGGGPRRKACRRSRMSRSTSCRFTSSARSTTRSRSTSSCSPTASGSPSATSMRFGDAQFIAAPLQTAAADRLWRGRYAVRARRPRSFPASNLLRDFFSFPNKFLGFKLRGLAQAAVADRCAGLRRAVRVSLGAAQAGLDRQPGDVFALHRCRPPICSR